MAEWICDCHILPFSKTYMATHETQYNQSVMTKLSRLTKVQIGKHLQKERKSRFRVKTSG